MKSNIHFIRHGITEGNVKRWYYGATDVPLLDEGITALAELRSSGIYPPAEGAKFYTSGMLRTEQTLDAIYGNVPHGTLPLFREMNFGDWECRTFDSLKTEPLFNDWINDRTGSIAYPGGESMNEFHHRIHQGIDELFSLHNETASEATIVVCHGGVIASIMEYLFKGQRETFWHWIPDPGHGYSLLLEGDEVEGYKTF